MSPAHYILAALGLAVLMVVHESGHFLAARRFGMRVTRFSIGFGPRLYRHRSKDSSTEFQIALIPFLAYVQIAGMNPYEDHDPNDKGSYANASWWARVVTIVAGPLANYFFASILFFIGFLVGGRPIADEASMRVLVTPDGPAAMADVRDGDKIVAVDTANVKDWDELRAAISKHPGEKIDLTIERDGQPVHIFVTPGEKGKNHEGKIMVGPWVRVEKVTVAQAAVLGVVEPPKVVYGLVRGLIRMIRGKEKFEASGPVGITKEVAAAVKSGPGDAFKFLGALSAYLGGFNLLPIPALDGGRLLFLLFEAVSRRRPDAKIEAQVHAVGLLLMLTLIAIVTINDWRHW